MIRLAALHVHPVKSTAVRPVRHAEVEAWGLRDDRRWMVVDDEGECITAREERSLLTITADTPATAPEVGSALRLRAPGHRTIELDQPSGDPVPVTVHGRSLEAVVAYEPAQAWIRSVLGRADVTLVHVHRPRPLNPAFSRLGDATAFADGYPVTLASAASVRQLDTWATDTALDRGEETPRPLVVERFRPNLVVEGDLEPFEEDRWRRVTVGPVTFRVVKPVDRCVLTTVDPVTLERGPEPLRTLARHRKRDGATWFAVQLVPDAQGVVRLGDEAQPER